MSTANAELLGDRAVKPLHKWRCKVDGRVYDDDAVAGGEEVAHAPLSVPAACDIPSEANLE